MCLCGIIRLIESLRMALSFHFAVICVRMKETRCFAVCDRSVINFHRFSCISQIKSILQVFVFPVAIFCEIVIKSFHRKRQNYGRVSKIIQENSHEMGKCDRQLCIRWHAPYPFGIHWHTDCYVAVSYVGVIFSAFIRLNMWDSCRRRFHHIELLQLRMAGKGEHLCIHWHRWWYLKRCAYREMRWNSNHARTSMMCMATMREATIKHYYLY